MALIGIGHVDEGERRLREAAQDRLYRRAWYIDRMLGGGAWGKSLPSGDGVMITPLVDMRLRRPTTMRAPYAVGVGPNALNRAVSMRSCVERPDRLSSMPTPTTPITLLGTLGVHGGTIGAHR